MEPNQRAARTHRGLSIFYGLIATLAFVIAFLHNNLKTDIVTFILLLAALSALHVFIAQAAFQKKPWARTASKVIGGMLLLGFPIGTYIGILLISYSGKPWAANA